MTFIPSFTSAFPFEDLSPTEHPEVLLASILWLRSNRHDEYASLSLEELADDISRIPSFSWAAEDLGQLATNICLTAPAVLRYDAGIIKLVERHNPLLVASGQQVDKDWLKVLLGLIEPAYRVEVGALRDALLKPKRGWEPEGVDGDVTAKLAQQKKLEEELRDEIEEYKPLLSLFDEICKSGVDPTNAAKQAASLFANPEARRTRSSIADPGPSTTPGTMSFQPSKRSKVSQIPRGVCPRRSPTKDSPPDHVSSMFLALMSVRGTD